MNCPKCGQAVADGSSFCGKCGAAVGAAAPTGVPASREQAGPETPVWEERPSIRTSIPMLVACGVVYLLGILVVSVVAAKLPHPYGDGRGLPLQFLWLGVMLVATVALLAKNLLGVYSVRYRLTSQRLFIERGILNKRIDEVELEKYKDVFVSQDLLDRMVGCGDVRVVTGDVTNEVVEIKDVQDPIGRKEIIRKTARERQAAIGIIRREDL